MEEPKLVHRIDLACPEDLRELIITATLKEALETDANGRTVLHALTRRGRTNQIPTAWLNEESLTKADAAGCTPLHWAAELGDLFLLPPEVLSVKNLTISTHDGRTPLKSLAKHGHINQVPGLEESEFPALPVTKKLEWMKVLKGLDLPVYLRNLLNLDWLNLQLAHWEAL